VREKKSQREKEGGRDIAVARERDNRRRKLGKEPECMRKR